MNITCGELGTYQVYLRGGTLRDRKPEAADHAPVMSKVQRLYLARGLAEPGGKLPIFDREGQEISKAIIEACVRAGWAEPWYHNPIKKDWLVCKLTVKGRLAVAKAMMPGAGTATNSPSQEKLVYQDYTYGR